MTPTRLIETWSIPEPNSGCWLWLGTLDDNNRARCSCSWRGHTLAAHVVLTGINNVEIPQSKGWMVCHRCDNPSCVNPVHIYLGTPKSNARDREENLKRYGHYSRTFQGQPHKPSHKVAFLTQKGRDLRDQLTKGAK